MKKQKFLLCQPHSDDILLSCAHYLFNSDYEVCVLTVENDEKRISEDNKLFEFLDIPHAHLDVPFKDESYYGFHKEYKEVTSENSYEYLKGYFGKEVLKNIEKALIKWVKNFTEKNKGYTIVAPWGIGNPFHIFVRDILERNFEGLLYYREFPHSYKKRSRAQLDKQSLSYKRVELITDVETHEVKFQLASKFYRTQSGLLFYEQNYIKKQLPEEIYKKL